MVTFGTGGRNGSERVDDLIGIGTLLANTIKLNFNEFYEPEPDEDIPF
jgi:hypothetical protein